MLEFLQRPAMFVQCILNSVCFMCTTVVLYLLHMYAKTVLYVFALHQCVHSSCKYVLTVHVYKDCAVRA